MKKSVSNYFSKQKRKRICLWANELFLDDSLFDLLRALHSPCDPRIDMLKQSLRRCVFRVNHFSDKYPTVIVKGFPLKKMESRLKYKKYGLAETYNYLRAEEYELPIPACYGYFEHRSFGTVKSNGVLIEDLNGYKTLDDLVKESRSQRLSVLSRATPIIAQLFKTGVNHIDLSPHNFMESGDGQRIVLIDWQYCSFLPMKDSRQLVFQAAQFLKYTDLVRDEPDWLTWLEVLYEACSPSLKFGVFCKNVALVQSKKRASIKDRLSLTLDLCG